MASSGGRYQGNNETKPEIEAKHRENLVPHRPPTTRPCALLPTGEYRSAKGFYQ